MKTRKGFTLIEILIVIAVMGILASMMMISSSESTSTARANNIVSNLRNFSMAAMALYTDSMDYFGKTPNATKNLMPHVKKYMYNEGNIPDKDKYRVSNASGIWWAGYDLSGSDSGRIREKLEGRASSANLKGTKSDNPPANKGEDASYNKSDTYVWLLIRSSKK